MRPGLVVVALAHREPSLERPENADRYNQRIGAQRRWRFMDNIRDAVLSVSAGIVKQQVTHFDMCDPECGRARHSEWGECGRPNDGKSGGVRDLPRSNA